MIEKKRINIDFCGFWGSFNKEKNLFTNILSKYFQVNICEKPDFVICSNRGKPFEYMKYDCVRIIFMGENLSPDFTVFDYAIGFDFLSFSDRYFRLPFAFYQDDGRPWVPEKITEEQAWSILKQKKYFCNFIYGHKSAHGMREELFRKLSEYKDVVSPGSYLNNVNHSKKRCSWAEKDRYLSESKFTIAGDSIQYPGFVTEKIVQPFLLHSVPIYVGNPEIRLDFNPKAFLCCETEEDVETTIEKVRLLDNNDDAFIQMLMECPLNDVHYAENLYRNLEKFLVNIFSQDRERAFRRIKGFCADSHESYLRNYWKQYERTPQIVHIIRDKLKK